MPDFEEWKFDKELDYNGVPAERWTYKVKVCSCQDMDVLCGGSIDSATKVNLMCLMVSSVQTQTLLLDVYRDKQTANLCNYQRGGIRLQISVVNLSLIHI